MFENYFHALFVFFGTSILWLILFAFVVDVLTVRETLHLIPEADMLATDTKLFPDYAYCPIIEANRRPKNAKLQFVALVTTKPEVKPGMRLEWKVVDRSGEV